MRLTAVHKCSLATRSDMEVISTEVLSIDIDKTAVSFDRHLIEGPSSKYVGKKVLVQYNNYIVLYAMHNSCNNYYYRCVANHGTVCCIFT